MELARCPFSSAGIPTAPWTATCGRRHTQIGPRGLGFQAFETFLAGAIQKAVRWTGCTKSQECAVKSSPRPMKPHAQIVCRDAQRFRHFAARLTEQIHLPDQLGILARHHRRFSTPNLPIPGDAAAPFFLHLRAGSNRSPFSAALGPAIPSRPLAL